MSGSNSKTKNVWNLNRSVVPKVIVLSSDPSVVTPVSNVCASSGFQPERWDFDGVGYAILAQPNIRLIVVDDAGIKPAERSWLLTQVRRRSPDAFVIYIAAEHDGGTEIEARKAGAHYYTSKPPEPDLLNRVVGGFLNSAL